MKTQTLQTYSVAALVIIVAYTVATAQDLFTAAEITEWRVAAEKGESWAQYNLGLAYESGNGVAVNKSESVRWYLKAAEQGDVDAQFNVGWAYDIGAGVVTDEREAVRWYRKAAKQGNAYAQNNLGAAYAAGEGVTVDKREAARWYRKAAEQGYVLAQSNLGWVYANGEGVTVDKREAVRWYRKAAEQGNAVAQNNLGWIYANGDGVTVDKREAVRWYREAAAQGYAHAQTNLGYAYDVGAGIAEDNREAARWYHKAAEQGDAVAQHNLGSAYWSGEGVIEDTHESYIWYSIAKANGDEDAANDLRDLNWHDYLSKSEIRAAKKEAARRLEAIDRRDEEGGDTRSIDNVIAAPKPKGSNTAMHVFESTWRSVVVVLRGNVQGSGVIVDPNIVATNCHILEDRGKITVYKSTNRRANTDIAFSARVRYADKSKDFCLLDVAGLQGVPATVRKYDTLNVGEDVYGLGAPQGLNLSLSVGVISQLREWDGNRFIQTDTAISPGSSGGGLFDSEGNLVGITTAKITEDDSEGIGFAIPADLVLGY